MTDEKPKKTVVHLNHAPLVLRVDEMVDGEIAGSKVAKKVGEFSLERGLTEVDADLWNKWYEQNKEGPLVMGGLVSEHKQESDDGEAGDGEGGEPGGTGGPHPEQGAVRDGGVEAGDERPAPTVQDAGEGGVGAVRDGD